MNRKQNNLKEICRNSNRNSKVNKLNMFDGRGRTWIVRRTRWCHPRRRRRRYRRSRRRLRWRRRRRSSSGPSSSRSGEFRSQTPLQASSSRTLLIIRLNLWVLNCEEQYPIWWGDGSVVTSPCHLTLVSRVCTVTWSLNGKEMWKNTPRLSMRNKKITNVPCVIMQQQIDIVWIYTLSKFIGRSKTTSVHFVITSLLN